MRGVLILDCADGQLARARGGGNRIGRIRDGIFGPVTAISLHVGALIHLLRTRGEGFPAVPRAADVELVAAAGILIAIRSVIRDELKGRARRLLEGDRDERDSPEAVRREIRRRRSRHSGPVVPGPIHLFALAVATMVEARFPEALRWFLPLSVLPGALATSPPTTSGLRSRSTAAETA